MCEGLRIVFEHECAHCFADRSCLVMCGNLYSEVVLDIGQPVLFIGSILGGFCIVLIAAFASSFLSFTYSSRNDLEVGFPVFV